MLVSNSNSTAAKELNWLYNVDIAQDLDALNVSKVTAGLETAVNILLWLSVYFFALLPLCTTMACSHTLVFWYNLDYLHKRFPLSFHRRLHLQLGWCGITCLFLAAIFHAKLPITVAQDSSQFVDLDLDLDLDESARLSILLAASCAPFLLLQRYGYEGARLFLNWFLLDNIPGMKHLWWCAHIILGGFVLVKLGLTNRIAGVILATSWITLAVLPTCAWLLSFRRGRFNGSQPQAVLESSDRNTARSVTLQLDSLLLLPDKPRDFDVGLEFYLLHWRSFGIIYRSISTSTVTEASVRQKHLLPYEIESFYFFDIWFPLWEEHLSWKILVAILFIVQFLYLSAFVVLEDQVKRLPRNARKASVDILVSPPSNRSLGFLCDKTKLPSRSLFVMEGSGIVVSMGYLQKYTSQSNLKQVKDVTFLWICRSVLDSLKIHKLLADYVNRHELTGIHFRVLLLDSFINGPVVFRGELMSDKTIGGALEKILSNMQPGALDVVTLGSSNMAYEVRLFLSHSKWKSWQIQPYEAVFEESFFRLPAMSF